MGADGWFTDMAWTDLLGRYALPGSDGPYEHALWLKLTSAKQQLVRYRLTEIDAFLKARENGGGDPGEVAERLGVSTRSLYRAIARVGQFGPVAGLAPSAGAGRKRRADAFDELPEAIEISLKDLMATMPDPRWRTVMQTAGVLPSTEPGPGPGPGREPAVNVSASTVRRHANAMKQKPLTPGEGTFGRSWLIDRVAVDLRVEGDGGEQRYFVAAFLVDRETRIIGAVADASRMAGAGGGVPGLVSSMRDGHPIVSSRIKMARRIEEVVWVLPPSDEIISMAASAVENGRSAKPPVEVTPISKGKFRQGSELAKLIGDRLGPVRLLVRATADPAMEGKPGLTVLASELALEVVSQAAAVWNRKLLAGTHCATPTRTSRREKLNALIDSMALLFETGEERS